MHFLLQGFIILFFLTQLGQANAHQCVWFYSTREVKLTFEQSFLATTDLEFKKIWTRSLSRHKDFKSNQHYRSPELDVTLRKLGFVFGLGQAPEAPTFSEFLKNYISILVEKKIPREKWILPVLKYEKSDAGEGTLSEVYITPGLDLLPKIKEDDPHRWVLVTDENLESTDVHIQLTKNRYPGWLEFHDALHFALFATYPDVFGDVPRLIKTFHTKTASDSRGQLSGRMNFLFEFLELVPAEKAAELEKHFSEFGFYFGDAGLNVKDFKQNISQMSRQMLKKRALKILQIYETLVAGYGPSVLNRYELGEMAKDDGVQGNLLYHHVSKAGIKSVPTDNLRGLSLRLQSMIKLYLPANKTLLKERLSGWKGLRLLRDPIKAQNVEISEHDLLNLDNTVIETLARLEFGLYFSAKYLTPKKVVHDLLAPILDWNSPTLFWIEQAFGKVGFIPIGNNNELDGYF